jgi:peptidoglycan hydrolase CwlO-like protein
MKKLLVWIFALIVIAAAAFGTYTVAKNMTDKDKKTEVKRTVYTTASEFETGVLNTCNGLDSSELQSDEDTAGMTEKEAADSLKKARVQIEGFVEAFSKIDAPEEYEKDWKTLNKKITALSENIAQLETQLRELIKAQAQINGISSDSEAQTIQENINEIGATVQELSTEFDTTNSEIETLGTKLNIGECFGV